MAKNYQALFESAVQPERYAADKTGGGPLRLVVDLMQQAYELGKRITHEEIDTAEERAAIVSAAMTVFDSVVAKLIQASPVAGILATTARNTLVVWLTRAIEQAELALR